MLTSHSAELLVSKLEYRWHFHSGSTGNWRNNRNNRKIDSEQNFVIFSDSESVLKGISNTCTMNNTSHITQMLQDKIERLES
jgi:hypothetical protein